MIRALLILSLIFAPSQKLNGPVLIQNGVTLPKASAGSPTASFDVDNGNIDVGWTSVPTITPAGSGELIYAAATVSSAITSPTGGGTQGSYTGVAGGITGGVMAEYNLSGPSGAILANFSPAQANSTMIAAFKWSGGTTTTHIQGASSTTATTTLGSNPTLGNTVICSALHAPTGTLAPTAVQDTNGNVYTISTNSPSPNQSTGGAGSAWIVYLLSAPSNADKAITFTFGGTGVLYATFCDEFHRS